MRENDRSSNFELLRIVSMVLIVLSHYVTHGGLLMQSISANQIIAQLFKLGGKLGVTCFVLISGYFLVDSKFKTKNIIKLNIQILFYSIIALILIYLFEGSIGIGQLVKSLFAPVYGIYWYPTAYIGLYLCVPILNMIVSNSKDKLKNILICMFIVLSLVNCIIPKSNFLYSNIAWFIFLYLGGAFFKRNKNTYYEQKALWLFIVNILIMWGSSIVLNIIGSRYNIISITDKAYYFSNLNSPFMFSAGIGMFLIFKKMKCKQSKTINYIAASTFAVYLCHDNDFVREIIWGKIFHTSKYFNSNICILFCHMIFSVLIIFLVALILEIPRTWISKKIINSNFISDNSEKIDKWYNNFD